MVIVYNIGSHLRTDTSPCVWAMLRDSREREADSQRRTYWQTDVSLGSTAADLLLRTHRHPVRTSRGKSLRPNLRTQPTMASRSGYLQHKASVTWSYKQLLNSTNISYLTVQRSVTWQQCKHQLLDTINICYFTVQISVTWQYKHQLLDITNISYFTVQT